VREDRIENRDVELAVRIGKRERGRTDVALWVVSGVEEIDEREAEVRKAGADLLPAPVDRLGPDVESLVSAAGRQIGSQRDCRATDATADVEDTVVGAEANELAKLGEVTLPQLEAAADDLEEGARRGRDARAPARGGGSLVGLVSSAPTDVR
jgi:hypothetical protein